jgi:hypothetical protein
MWSTWWLLRGEIVAPNHYHLLEVKTKGTMSMPYYSTKQNYLLLIYFITITHIISKESYKKKKRKVRAITYSRKTYHHVSRLIQGGKGRK